MLLTTLKYSQQTVKIYIEGDDVISLYVRPWFDTVKDLQARAFAPDTPSRRQQLLLDGKKFKDDGRVLAQHGVVVECTISLVSSEPNFTRLVGVETD